MSRPADQLLAMELKLVAITLGKNRVFAWTKSRKEIIKAFQDKCGRHDGQAHSFGRRIMQYPFYE